MNQYEYNNTLENLSVTNCPTSKTVGSIVNISSTAVGGTAPYEVIIKKDGVEIYHTTKTILENAPVLTTYTIQTVDAGKTISLSSYIIDSCLPTNQTSTTEVCSFSVPLAACPTLTCSLSITPTTITLGQYITFTSTAIGGQGAAEHILYMDGVDIYGTGPGWGAISSASITPSTSGTHTFYSKVYDQCTVQQSCTSSTVTITVAAACVTPTGATITPTSPLTCGSTVPVGTSVSFTGTVIGGQANWEIYLYDDTTQMDGWTTSSSSLTLGPVTITEGIHNFTVTVLSQCDPFIVKTSSICTITGQAACTPLSCNLSVT